MLPCLMETTGNFHLAKRSVLEQGADRKFRLSGLHQINIPERTAIFFQKHTKIKMGFSK